MPDKMAELTDIKGVGPARARQLQKAGVKTVDEFAEKEMAVRSVLPKNVADEAIESAADLSINPGSGVGRGVNGEETTSKIGVGSFEVAQDEFNRANEIHRKRSETSRRSDEEKTAPLTTNLERWKDNPDELDFPGVDTSGGVGAPDFFGKVEDAREVHEEKGLRLPESVMKTPSHL